MNKKSLFRLLILLFLLFFFIFSLRFYLIEKEKIILTVVFLDIGQGDAIFIDTPKGNQMLIDGGPGKAILRELSQVMPFYDKSIDIVMATHPDADHIGGLNDVIERYKAGLFLEPGVESDTSIYKELKQKVLNQKIKTIEVRRGMAIDFGDEVKMEILFPKSDPKGMETNTASIVAKLIYGENEFLLTGDSPKSIEEYLVGIDSYNQIKIKSDVLKVGHHGSKTSTSELYVKSVDPQYAVISVGKDNRYGHPNKEVLNTLENYKIKILRTDEQGRITFESDGSNLKQK